ncbi:ATP-binding protein [Streptomyces sp. S1D4-11]
MGRVGPRLPPGPAVKRVGVRATGVNRTPGCGRSLLVPKPVRGRACHPRQRFPTTGPGLGCGGRTTGHPQHEGKPAPRRHPGKLGLPRPTRSPAEQVGWADAGQTARPGFPGLVPEEELAVREERRFRHALRPSRLPHHMTVEEDDFSHQPELDPGKPRTWPPSRSPGPGPTSPAGPAGSREEHTLLSH